MEQRNYGAIGKYASSAIRKTYTLGCDSERVRKCRRGNCRGYCENGAESIESSEAPAEAFWRSACSVGLLTAHNLPRQLRLVEPEPTSPPSRPAEAGAAYPGLKTVLGGAIRLLRPASAAHFFGRRVHVRAAQAARPAPSAPPGQGASTTGACAVPTRRSYHRAPADPALALVADPALVLSRKAGGSCTGCGSAARRARRGRRAPGRRSRCGPTTGRRCRRCACLGARRPWAASVSRSLG